MPIFIVGQLNFPIVSLFFFVMAFNFHEEDRPAEKGLDLPARSRFGEGRAESLTELTCTLENL